MSCSFVESWCRLWDFFIFKTTPKQSLKLKKFFIHFFTIVSGERDWVSYVPSPLNPRSLPTLILASKIHVQTQSRQICRYQERDLKYTCVYLYTLVEAQNKICKQKIQSDFNVFFLPMRVRYNIMQWYDSHKKVFS